MNWEGGGSTPNPPTIPTLQSVSTGYRGALSIKTMYMLLEASVVVAVHQVRGLELIVLELNSV